MDKRIRQSILLGVVFCFLSLYGCQENIRQNPKSSILNDVHSQLNATEVAEVVYPKSIEDIVKIVQRSRKEGKAVSISGGRHAMGGQQFGRDTIHISMIEMDDVLAFDQEKGIVKVEAGITWPKLIEYLKKARAGRWPQWTIKQKQTGADNLTLGGTLSANAHGRGVHFKPIIEDVAAFTLVDAKGNILNVSREENSELFKLAIGGYGLFGVIATVDLKLQYRRKLQRVVEVISIDQLPEKTKQRIDEGFLYGDFQYKTNEQAEDFMRVGVFSTYKPVPWDTPMPPARIHLMPNEWHKLMLLAHTDKEKAFEVYSRHYLKTNGQIYWSDELQLGYYDENYEERLKTSMADYREGSLMITEVYVPPEEINNFIEKIIQDERQFHFNIIYGTMRLIKQDDESFLAWAKRDYACVIFNLRVEHSPKGLEKAKNDFQRIIDRALELDGSYYLTYHRWARKDQVLKAYPQFVEFLKLKRRYDPQEIFQSEWYRYYKTLFAKELK